MARGQYDRHAARLAREARHDAAQGECAAPAIETRGPMRLTAPHGYIERIWSRDVRFEWSAGEVITDRDEVEHLRSRGADMEPV